MDKIQELENRIEGLEQVIKNLGNAQALPLDIVEAMRKRLAPVSGDSNSTNPSTVTRAVNEAGSATYNVANVPTGFITIVVNGNSRTVPYY